MLYMGCVILWDNAVFCYEWLIYCIWWLKAFKSLQSCLMLNNCVCCILAIGALPHKPFLFLKTFASEPFVMLASSIDQSMQVSYCISSESPELR